MEEKQLSQQMFETELDRLYALVELEKDPKKKQDLALEYITLFGEYQEFMSHSKLD